jgi:hypothetical protein
LRKLRAQFQATQLSVASRAGPISPGYEQHTFVELTPIEERITRIRSDMYTGAMARSRTSSDRDQLQAATPR